MREQLIQYVNLLFAGADAEEIKMEILQNTLDRYDDMIDQGKTPEAAYRLAITGIGDVNEILGAARQPVQSAIPIQQAIHAETDSIHKRILRAVAIALYILCPIPLFVMNEIGMDTLGLCGTLALVAVATVLIILGKKPESEAVHSKESEPEENPRHQLHESVDSVIWAIGLALYFIISFATKAWFITWVIFPLIGSLQGLVKAIMDLKEAGSHEN